jgi:hypothetical protein
LRLLIARKGQKGLTCESFRTPFLLEPYSGIRIKTIEGQKLRRLC